MINKPYDNNGDLKCRRCFSYVNYNPSIARPICIDNAGKGHNSHLI